MQDNAILLDYIQSLNLSITVATMPIPIDDNGWMHWSHTVAVTGKHKTIIAPYRTGLAHTNWPAFGYRGCKKITPLGLSAKDGFQYVWPRGTTNGEVRYFESAKPKKPELVDILYNLIMDAQCVDGEDFEGFCLSCGYDTDSMSAHETYKACQRIRRELRKILTEDQIETLSDLFQDY